MKNLDEKKLLVKMARMLGQPVDQELLESIEKEEQLAKLLFKEEPAPAPILVEETIFEPQVLIEAPPKSEPVFEPPFPKEQDRVQQVVNHLKSASPPPPNNALRDKELDNIRKTLAEMTQKIATLSWGGGGTGVVRIGATDDFDKYSYGEGRFLKWSNGMFRLDEINSQQVTYNTSIADDDYFVLDEDYYIGVTVSPITVTLPATTTSGRTIVIKDETGNAQNNNIIIAGNIDNDAGGVILAINNGAVQLLFRNGWRII